MTVYNCSFFNVTQLEERLTTAIHYGTLCSELFLLRFRLAKITAHALSMYVNRMFSDLSPFCLFFRAPQVPPPLPPVLRHDLQRPQRGLHGLQVPPGRPGRRLDEVDGRALNGHAEEAGDGLAPAGESKLSVMRRLQ